jgi:hypothetical protein
MLVATQTWYRPLPQKISFVWTLPPWRDPYLQIGRHDAALLVDGYFNPDTGDRPGRRI